MLRFIPYLFVLSIFTCLQGFSNSSRCYYPHRYVGVEFGNAWSTTATINAPNPPWDFATQGYDDSLGTSPIYGLMFGFQFSPLFRADIRYQYRPDFCYELFQTSPNGIADKTRNFSLSTSSLLFNGYLHTAGISSCPCLNFCGVSIDPFIGGGIGISYHWLYSFYSISDVPPNETFAMMLDNLDSAFSWHVDVGLDFNLTCAIIELGYRYLDTGSFSSNNFLIDDPDQRNVDFLGRTTKPWNICMSTHELFVSLRYPF